MFSVEIATRNYMQEDLLPSCREAVIPPLLESGSRKFESCQLDHFLFMSL